MTSEPNEAAVVVQGKQMQYIMSYSVAMFSFVNVIPCVDQMYPESSDVIHVHLCTNPVFLCLLVLSGVVFSIVVRHKYTYFSL